MSIKITRIANPLFRAVRQPKHVNLTVVVCTRFMHNHVAAVALLQQATIFGAKTTASVMQANPSGDIFKITPRQIDYLASLRATSPWGWTLQLCYFDRSCNPYFDVWHACYLNCWVFHNQRSPTLCQHIIVEVGSRTVSSHHFLFHRKNIHKPSTNAFKIPQTIAFFNVFCSCHSDALRARGYRRTYCVSK